RSDPDGRPDARRRCEHKARSLRSDPRGGAQGAHLPVVHHGAGRTEELRARLCVPQRPHRRRPRARPSERGGGHSFLVLRGGAGMSATTAPARAEHHIAYRRRLRAALPVLSFLLVLAAISSLNPRAMSYLGFNLMLNLSIPLAFATLGQMFVIVVNDIDLSIGYFVSFV